MKVTVQKRILLLFVSLFVITSSSKALTYAEWLEGYTLPEGMNGPLDDPDGDAYPNALEFIFNSHPLLPDSQSIVGPKVEEDETGQYFVYRLYDDLDSGVVIGLEKSHTLMGGSWTEVPRTASGTPDPDNPSILIFRQLMDDEDGPAFYRLTAIVPYTPDMAAKIEVGAQVGAQWEGINPLLNAYVYQLNPPVSESDSGEDNSRYPRVVGASQVSFTQNFLQDYENRKERSRRRSWMGWFLWANGTPPPGHVAGFPYKDPNNDSVTPWDYYVWQYTPTEGIDNGSWTPVRIDQQPLYLHPLRLNYNWPAGKFGYETQPMKHFPGEAKYWKEKKIVRGVNLSPNYPYFVQYGNRIDFGEGAPYPDVWRESWLRIKIRPLETFVIVPSVLPPSQLLTEGAWNNVGTVEEPEHEVFPYPVFNSAESPQVQTPFAIMTDRMGDWHADLVWEGTHPGQPEYNNRRYHRTAYSQAGKGNYLKMTVAQGSPFVWCEFHADQTSDEGRYVIFYDLIRQNLPGSIDNNNGTNAGLVEGGPWPVPGVEGVSYVLLYGDQNNPNQWFHEVDPEFNYRPDPDHQPDYVMPGGFNPPGNQSNHTYFAVFYRTDTVEEVTAANSGTDAQGNPYFYLKFKDNPAFSQTGKNWFVVGQVPVMRYYHTEVPRDSQEVRDAAARAWAEEMGKYAFNFLSSTKVEYEVTNMYEVTTHFNATYQNPYVEAGVANASAMTAEADKTVWALFPHHYQPFTLGADLTKASRPQVVWNPLVTTGIDFPNIAGPANANKINPSSPSFWGYWHPRGNLKSVITGGFTVVYPFQNFLPAMPEPKWDHNYDQTGIQQVVLSNVEGYTRITEEPTATLVDKRAGKQGSGAQFKVLLEPYTGRVMQVDVVSGGSGYPVGNPPPASEAEPVISPPPIAGGRQAKARIQTDGDGRVLAVFMNDKGSGYQSTIQIEQPGNTSYDPPIVVPLFDDNPPYAMLPGKARIISGGAGFDFSKPINATVIGNGTGAVARVVRPGEIYGIESSTIGGFDSAGLYPLLQDSLEATADNIRVEIPPPPGGGTAPTAKVEMQNVGNLFGILIENPGKYTEAPTSAYYLNDNDVQIQLTLPLVVDGEIRKVDLGAGQSAGNITTRKPVVFVGGVGEEPAVAWAYPGASIKSVVLTSEAPDAVYESPVEVVFTGGDVGPGSENGTFVMPVFDWHVDANGKVVLNGFKDNQNGSGFWGPALFKVMGGRGHNAAALAVVDEHGAIMRVDVIRSGSNYPTASGVIDGIVRAPGGGVNATVKVNVNPDGTIGSIDVITPGSGYAPGSSVPVELVAAGGESADASPPRGHYAEIIAQADGNGGLMNPIIRNDSGPMEQGGYLPNSDGETSDLTGRLYLKYFDVENRQVLSPTSQGAGYLTQSIPVTINVEQTLYDNLIGEYTTGMSDGVRPFGGAFGGNSAPDGYGLGNQLSATVKTVNVLYHLQHAYAETDRPSVKPSRWAMIQGNTPFVENPGPGEQYTYERGLPILRDHNPIFTLRGALKTSVQMMQRTLSLLHADPRYSNNPEDPQVWKMDYFSTYDFNAGRIVINPSATIPVYGVVSSVYNPPEPSGNEGKAGLNEWKPGKLWSGFGVSDQWNDQHYFYGYYLGVAGWSAIFDYSWESEIDGKPANVWADPGQMGTALDQWFLSIAYDPDNEELLESIYSVPEFTYQKFPFFDQWTGHGWATGVPPGPAGLRDPNTPWNVAVSSGTGNFGYGDENENSIWEGLQAFSAAILWGAGTDRKPLTDVGLYMLATGMVANDIYFADKNYNLSDNPTLNQYSWVPVTTVNSSQVPNNGGNNSYPANSSYNTGAREAFYVSKPYFGGEASPGISLYRKFGPTLNNFFYAFPTGSMFILAYPPTAWTLGISRNTDYVRARYGAMMREEWREARDSALYQPGNWLGMAMTAALCGVPYNPGDQPLNESGTALNPDGPAEYVKRLWASWVSLDGVAGREAARQPAFSSTSVMHFLHALDIYGVPDWTYRGRAANSVGANDDSTIMLMAVFSKLEEGGSSVQTTFIAFNPGWTTRYAVFDRLGSDGSVASSNASGVLTVPPKRMVAKTVSFPVQ